MRTVSQLFVVFALGLIATGFTLGLLPAGERGCGAAFSGGGDLTEACDEPRAQRRQIPVALIGLGVTAGIAAAVAADGARSAK